MSCTNCNSPFQPVGDDGLCFRCRDHKDDELVMGIQRAFGVLMQSVITGDGDPMEEFYATLNTSFRKNTEKTNDR